MGALHQQGGACLLNQAMPGQARKGSNTETIKRLIEKIYKAPLIMSEADLCFGARIIMC